MPRETVIREPKITEKAVTYWVAQIIIGLTAPIVTIPLLVVAIPLTRWYARLYISRMRIALTTRSLKVRRGILFVEEKTIPLDKITDMAIYQGPLMRWIGIEGVRVETAGQTSDSGALVTLVGLDDPNGFRDLALNQRDAVVEGDVEPASSDADADVDRSEERPTAAATPVTTDGAVLTDIRDTLHRIEQCLTEQSEAESS